MTLTELSIKRPTLIIIFFLALSVIGIFSYYQLSYELLPKMSPPILTVQTIYPGAAPNEVETSITKILEEALSGLEGITSVRGTSAEGASFIFCEFNQSTKIDLAMQDALRKVSEVQYRLPSTAKTPTVSKIAIDEIPVMRIGITAKMDDRELYQILKNQIKPRLSSVAGVGQVLMYGGQEREIKVFISQEKLFFYGLSILQVTQAIQTANLDFPTGRIEDTDKQFVVRVAGKFVSIEEMKELVVGISKQGGSIRLADLAEVIDSQKDLSVLSRLNGISSISTVIQKQSDANGVVVSKNLRDEIAKIEKENERYNLKFEIAQDGSTFTVEAANAVKFDLMLAVILVALVMLLFLHSIRNSLIIMISIPASMISTFTAMYFFGYTLNLMTLLGLSLVVGILVDDSIVVLENIYHHLEKGKDKVSASIIGRNEIGFAALAITLVDVCVFLPLAMVSGLVGNILRQFSMVVVVSTLLSLLVSFTLIPMLASRFAKLEQISETSFMGRIAHGFEYYFSKFTEKYGSALRWSFRNKLTVGIVTLVIFFASMALPAMGFIGSEFVSVADRGEFTVFIDTPSGTSIEKTNLQVLEVENLIKSKPDVYKTFTNVGLFNDGFIIQTGSNVAEINVTLVPKNKRNKSTDEIRLEIQNEVKQIPGLKVRANPIGIFGTANMTPIQLVISGANTDTVRKIAEKFEQIIKRIPGSTDVKLSSEKAKPELHVNIDREKLAKYGLSITDIGSTLRVALSGNDDSKFRAGSEEYDIKIYLDKFDRSSSESLKHLTFMNRSGKLIELQQFANIEVSNGPTKLSRENRNPAITIFAQVSGGTIGGIATEIDKHIVKETNPDIHYTWSGDVKNQRESNSSMGLAFLAGLLFTYMIMVALYDSFLYPLVVLFSVPVALVGAMLALALTMKNMSIFSMLGIIMLIGLVSKNAILLVDKTNHNRFDGGMNLFDALLDAGKTRVRPIMMTTLTMIIGMLPIAMSSSSGAEWKTGLAWALIGGLASSLMLSLILVPVMYISLENMKNFLTKKPREIFV